MKPDFRETVVIDFEFQQPDGGRPDPLCLIATELNSGRTHCLWRNQLRRLRSPPFDTGPDILVCAFFASAEMSCFLELGWQRPKSLVDLYAEDRAATNGLLPRMKGQHSLIMACTRRGIPVMLGTDKANMRDLILNRSNWSHEETEAIRHYCEADVNATVRLLRSMEEAGEIDWPCALLRGRYTAAVAAMERAGVPIDTETLARIAENWADIKRQLIRAIDADYQVYEDTTFKSDRFAAYLHRSGIPWPRTRTGALSLEEDTFRDMAKVYPQLNPLKELRSSLSELRLSGLTVGADHRNRCLLSPFSSKTGRNQPSNSKFIFGPAVWMRGLIQPPSGYGLGYVDWRAQEVGVAAALFGDERMMRAYLSGDVYLGFAKDAGLVPPDATTKSHRQIRDLCKVLVLSLNYGGGDELLASRLGVGLSEAARLKRLHQEIYPTFWRYSDIVTASAYANRYICSVFGWPLHVTAGDRPQSIMNFPMQSGGADMMRLAAIAATEAGIEVVAPVHDAFLILAPLNQFEEHIEWMQEIMKRAGAAVTGGMPMSTDVKRVKRPARYRDKRGATMWRTVMSLLPPPRAPQHAHVAQAPQRAQAAPAAQHAQAPHAAQRAQGPDPSPTQYR